MISIYCYILFKIALCLTVLENKMIFDVHIQTTLQSHKDQISRTQWSLYYAEISVRCLNSSHHTTTRSKELISSSKSSPNFNYDAIKILFYFISSGELHFNATCSVITRFQFSDTASSLKVQCVGFRVNQAIYQYKWQIIFISITMFSSPQN